MLDAERAQDAGDLAVLLVDADERILYARFFEQEGTASTLAALYAVLTRFGRFCQLYTDRGSHFCRTDQGWRSRRSARA